MEAKPAQLPSWISELRNAWNQEIDHLPDERRRFFISQQTDYLRRSSLASPPPGGHARAGSLLPHDIISSPPSHQSSLGGSFAGSLESSRSGSPRHSPTLSSRSLSPTALTPRLSIDGSTPPPPLAHSSLPSASSFAMPTTSPHPLQIQRMSSDRRASSSASNLTASLAAVASESRSAAAHATSAAASSGAAPPTSQFARRHSEMPLHSTARAAEDARCAAEASKATAAAAAAAAALSSSPPLFSRLYGALFGSSNSAEAKRAEMTRYSEKLKVGITQHEQRLMKLLKDRKAIAKRMSTECEQFQRWGLDALVSAARTLYETQLLRAGAQLELEGHQGALLSSQINAAQHAIEKGEGAALPPGQGAVLRDRDGKLMEVDRLIAPLSGYLPSDAPSVHQSVRALSSIIEHLQAAYDECQRRDLRVETIEQRSKRYESCLAKCFGAREVDVADAHAAAAVVVSDASSSSPTSQSSPSVAPSAAAGTTIGGMYFHPLGAEQHVFSQMLIDQRQSEGQKLARWEAWFAAAEPEKRSAEAVAAFWNFLVSTIQSKYKLPAELTSSSGISNSLQLCCTRVVFSRLQLNGHLSALASPAELAADLKFLRRLRWLQCAEQGALGIEPYFQYYWDSPEAERLVDGDPRAVVWPPRLQLLCTALLQLSAPTPLAAAAASSFSSAPAFTFPLHRRGGGRSLKSAAVSTPKAQSHASTPTAAALAALPTLRRDCLVRRSCWKQPDAAMSNEHAATAAAVGGSAESFRAPPADAVSPAASWHASEIDPEFPFARAIARLSRIRDLCVPEDILRELLATVREIHVHAHEHHRQYYAREAKVYAAKCLASAAAGSSPPPPPPPPVSPVLGADSLFPMVVWCVLHAHVPLHASIGHVERAFGAQLAFGEVGLCLTLVEAACRHLTNVSPREVGLPPGLPRFVHRLGLDSEAQAPPPAPCARDSAADIATAPAVSFGEVFGMSPPPPFQVPWPSERALQRQPPIGLGGINASDFAADDDDTFDDGLDEDDEDDEAGGDDDRIAGSQDEFPSSVLEADSNSFSAEHFSKSASAVFESGSVAADDAHLALLRRRFSGTTSGPSSRRASLSSSDAQPPAAPAASELIDSLKKLSIRVSAGDEIVEQAGLVMTESTSASADTNADEPDLR